MGDGFLDLTSLLISTGRGPADGDESSINSSWNSGGSSDGQKQLKEDKKFECQYCFKEFGNCQALGGHQNTYKKEQLKKKRM